MSNDKAWDSDVYSAKYANEFTMDLRDLEVGLNANADVPSELMCAWHVDASSIIRGYKDGKLTTVKTPDAGLPIALLGELAGIEIAADDVVSTTYDMDSPGIRVAVNDRTVVIGARSSDCSCEWRAAHNTSQNPT